MLAVAALQFLNACCANHCWAPFPATGTPEGIAGIAAQPAQVDGICGPCRALQHVGVAARGPAPQHHGGARIPGMTARPHQTADTLEVCEEPGRAAVRAFGENSRLWRNDRICSRCAGGDGPAGPPGGVCSGEGGEVKGAPFDWNRGLSFM